MIGACMGCSPIIIHVESAAGIKEGGKTGLTAVTIGSLFLLSIFFAPVFGKIPETSTAPVLVLVGAMMMGEAQCIDWTLMDQAIPAFLTIAIMPFTFSIPNGIIFGLFSSVFFYFTTGQFIKSYKRFRNGNNEENNVLQLSIPAIKDVTFLKDEFVRRPSLILNKSNIDQLNQNHAFPENIYNSV